MRRLLVLSAAGLLLTGCTGAQHHDGPLPALSTTHPASTASTSPPPLTFASLSAGPATSTCDSPNDLVVETQLVARSLVSCFAGVQEPPARLSVSVGTVLRIVGAMNGPVKLAPGQTVLRREGRTLTALRPGTTTVTTSGERCNLGTDPCGLLTVVVTAG
jgi:hypothetical protein